MYESPDVVVVPLQSDGGGAGGAIVGILFLLVILAITVAQIAGMWKTFEKAGQPGWAALIPVFNIYVLMKVADRPAWWTILAFIPILSLLPFVQAPHDIAKKFNKGLSYSFGLVFLPFIFYPLLGFGDAKYDGVPS